MSDTLSVQLINQSTTSWDLFFLIISAFIGGGVVTLIVDLIRERYRSHRIRRLIAYEIKINTELLDSDYVKHYPWAILKVWMAFYNSNSIEVSSFKHIKTAELIIKFYGALELLKEIDENNIDISYFNEKKLSYKLIKSRDRLGERKAELRSELLKLSKEILSDSQLKY